VTAAEIRAMLRERHDATGECDGCHRETELWEHESWDGAGPIWALCRRCWQDEARKATRQGKHIEAQVTIPEDLFA
jgi:hypothetical protein